MELRQIKPEEILLIKDFPPAEWQLDLSKVYQFHLGESYFYALVAIIDEVIAGTGMSILTGNTAWLGTIIVKEEFRQRGIGTAVTKHLIDWSTLHGSDKIILVASDLGLPVYKKLGFNHSMYYLAYTGGRMQDITSDSNVKKTEEKDIGKIIAIDQEVSGEKRDRIIEKTFRSGYKYVKDDGITGYYLPDFGKGVIVAKNDKAGIALLKFKYSIDNDKFVIPERNITAKRFLERNGFTLHAKYPRMCLGSDVTWNQEMIYSRGSGYLG